MRFRFPLYLFALSLNSSLGLAQNNLQPIGKEKFVIGETLQIHSEILDENRIINVYLPESYDSHPDNSYPVIYLLDGSRDEDFIHISGLVQFGSFSWINMLPESIVVGIGNVDRQRDFTYPTTDKTLKADIPTSGKSKSFIRFLESELQPFIQSYYRATDTETLIGQSLGGLLATEILLKKPDMFDNYVIVSPSLWWDNESLLGLQPKEHKLSKSIFIAVGKEGEMMERPAKELYELLKAQNKSNSRLFFEFMEDKDHGDALHIAVYHAFEKLFKK